jgi:hypothetical protein
MNCPTTQDGRAAHFPAISLQFPKVLHSYIRLMRVLAGSLTRFLCLILTLQI